MTQVVAAAPPQEYVPGVGPMSPPELITSMATQPPRPNPIPAEDAGAAMPASIACDDATSCICTPPASTTCEAERIAKMMKKKRVFAH